MSDKERMLDRYRPLMEAIVFLKDGTVDKVETPYGKEIPPSDRSPLVQKKQARIGRKSTHNLQAALFNVLVWF